MNSLARARDIRARDIALIAVLAIAGLTSACSGSSKPATDPTTSTSAATTIPTSVPSQSTSSTTSTSVHTPASTASAPTSATPTPSTTPAITATLPSTATTVQAGTGDPTALCNDNSYDYSKRRRDACVSHGGVHFWINEPSS